MNRKDIIWLYVYMTAGIIDLSLIAHNLWDYRFFSKPLVLLSLIIYFVKGSMFIKGSILRKSVCSALVFSLIGDVLLLFPSLYIYGMGAYLMVHFCYILAFKLAQKADFNISGLYFIKLFVYNLPFYLLSALLYFMIHHQLHQMKIPVVIYIFAMVLMGTIARERYKKTNPSSFWQVFIGAFLFFISQGLFLIHLFFPILGDTDVLMMGTYLLAQLLIVMGLRSHFLQVIHEKIDEHNFPQ